MLHLGLYVLIILMCVNIANASQIGVGSIRLSFTSYSR